MAFRFDWTPLHAVASLARQAGEAKAAETKFAQNMALRQMQDQADARQMSAANQEREAQQRADAFQLQIAAAKRDEERIAIAERRATASERTAEKTAELAAGRFGLAERKQTETERATGVREENAATGLAIRAANSQVYAERGTAPAAELIKMDKLLADSLSDLQESTDKNNKHPAYYKRDGKWYADRSWVQGDKEITDPVHIARLETSQRNAIYAAQRSTELQGQVSKMSGTQSMAVPDPAQSRFNAIFTAANAEGKEKLNKLRLRGMSDAEIVALFDKPAQQ